MGTKKDDVRLVVMMAGLALLALGSIYGVTRYRLHARRLQTQQALQNILEMLACFSDAYDRLPPAQVRDPRNLRCQYPKLKRPALYSWRFVLAPFDNSQLGFWGPSWELPWDALENQRVFDERDYLYPKSVAYCFSDPTRPDHNTRFAAIVGPGAAFDDEHPHKLNDLPAATIVVVEVKGSAVHWMQPGGDLDVRTMANEIGAEDGQGVAGLDSEGFFIGFADGEVWMLRYSVPFDHLEPFFLVEKARRADRQALLGPYRIRP